MKTINDYAELVKEKHALNKTIAPVETDLTDASRGYHIGEQFIIDGGLFKAKTEIAQHDALVLNTNYEPADNLTEQIKNAGGGTGTDPRLDVFENNIAPVETDETDASRAYQVGEQLILDNILYDVIAPISEHDVITTTGSGANIEPADPLSSQFQTLTNQVKDMNNVYGSKNVLIHDLNSVYKLWQKEYSNSGSWSGRAWTFVGVTYTFNEDGSVTLTGTSTGSPINMRLAYLDELSDGETYVLSNKGSTGHEQLLLEIDGTTAATITGNNTYEFVYDSTKTYRLLLKCINTGTTHNSTVYPMLCLKSIYDLDPTYAPPAKTNQQLTQDTTALLDNTEVNGAVNLAPNNATTQTINGITFTVNDDGSVTANGTATADASLLLSNVVYPKGTYKKSGCPSGGSYSTYFMGGTTGNDLGDGVTFTADGTTSYKLYCNVVSGATVSNLTFKPMLTVPSYNGDYVPYAKSNKELTEELEVESANITRLVSFSSLSSFQARKYGKVVELYFAGTLSEAVNTWTDFLTVPEGFRPSHYVQIVSFNTYNQCKNLQLAPSGGIQPAYNLAVGDFIRFTVTYIIN